MKFEHDLELGEMVSDSVTGYTGRLTAITFHYCSCVEGQITSCELIGGRTQSPEWFPISRIMKTAQFLGFRGK